ncbi:YceD family protein [Methylomonas sp. AM2-LC]|uniref:YceD family protein n=1 Tax=Methylomonas sp. AM2-LC TaxID=3153301 RepID=UPI00326316FA
MAEKIPDLIDPLVLAERRSMLSGTINVAAFERLSELITEQNGVVAVDVVFAKQGKRAVVSGNIKGTLQIECQSCLEAMPWPLDIAFKLGVVSSMQEADKLEIDCEPLVFEGEKISLNALIEDEILLTLPDYPKHGYECIKQKSSKASDYDKQNNQAKVENPFSVLAKLKNTGE